MIAQGLANHRADRQVRHEMVVHDIEMHDVCAGVEHGIDFVPQSREIGGKYGWCNQRFHSRSSFLVFRVPETLTKRDIDFTDLARVVTLYYGALSTTHRHP